MAKSNEYIVQARRTHKARLEYVGTFTARNEISAITKGAKFLARNAQNAVELVATLHQIGGGNNG